MLQSTLIITLKRYDLAVKQRKVNINLDTKESFAYLLFYEIAYFEILGTP
jgi:hypothetical protein